MLCLGQRLHELLRASPYSGRRRSMWTDGLRVINEVEEWCSGPVLLIRHSQQTIPKLSLIEDLAPVPRQWVFRNAAGEETVRLRFQHGTFVPVLPDLVSPLPTSLSATPYIFGTHAPP